MVHVTGCGVCLLLLVAVIASVATAEEQECVVGDDGTCISQASATDCVDGHEKCKFWAKSGECDANPNYMLKNCRVSCGTCEMAESALKDKVNRKVEENSEEKETDVTETPYGTKQIVASDKVKLMVENMTDYMENRVFKEKKFSKVKNECKNRHDQCAYWATIGECEVNPKYMLLNCAPMCQTCENIDFDARCPLDLSVPTILNPGDLNALFTNLTTKEHYKQYEPVVLSMPDAPKDDPSIQDGPWVVVLENFLTAEECDRLIGLGADRGYKISMDVGKKKFDGTYDSYKNNRRTSTNAWCLEECYNDPLTQNVLEKIENVTGVPDANSEYLQLLRYEPGQFYRTHHDYIDHHNQRQEGVRILTVFLYLNDVEAGGGTDFPKLKLTVMPKKGKALIWPSVLNDDPNRKDYRTDHQALPVEAGIKYGANAWLHQRDFKEAFDRSCH